MLNYGVYILSEDPPVFSVTDNYLSTLLTQLPPGLSPDLMVFGTWTYEPLLKAIRAFCRFPRSVRRRIFWMCATPREAQRLGMVGYRTAWCHHNLFCDETEFRPLNTVKLYDAVYTSVIRPYKRLELASAIKSLRIITGSVADIGKLPALGVGHAMVNEKFLDRRGVSSAISECRVGLALSAQEGGMLACTEYLLCGLPVVSTPSMGGRDVWLDNTNSIIVPPDALSVEAAVRRLVLESRDEHAIRIATLDRTRFFRGALSEAVRHVTGKLPFDPQVTDGGWFTRRFVTVHNLSDFLASYNGSNFERSDLLGKF